MRPVITPLAHERWFIDGDFPLTSEFLTESATIVALALAVLVTFGVRLLARFWPGVDVPAIARLAPYMPFAIRIHLAVSLIGLLSLGHYLSPAMDLAADLPGIVLGAGMVVCAIGMASGYRARAAAWLLVGLGPIGMLEFGLADVLQRVDLLGLAVFVIVAGPGRWSADHERGASDEPVLLAQAQAIWALKTAVGLALIVVAVYEKLGTPDLALTFLAEYPDFNVARSIFGLDVSDLDFVRVAGAIEVLFGLLLISGALTQAAILIAGVPFNVTLYFFGDVELLGHLPIYGAMLVLFVYASDPTLRPYLTRFRPPASAESEEGGPELSLA